jgi:Domain of unknown function (DUF4280)
MSLLVSAGAVLQCSFGAAPSSLSVLPVGRPLAPAPVATIADVIPFVNVMPFATCSSLANPAVAAATAAALGALSPMPCTPVPAGPWVPGVPGVLIGNMPALDQTCKLACAFGGVIQIVSPGQFVATAG